MELMLTKVYLLSNGLWPSLMAITREHEGSLESSTVIQDVRTRIPKDPEIARSAESFCPPTMLWPQTESPWGAHLHSLSYEMDFYFYFWDKCSHCRGSAGGGDGLIRVAALQVRMQKSPPGPAHRACLQTPPPFFPLLPLCPDPGCIVLRQPPVNWSSWVWSTSCPAATMTNYCSLSSPLYRQDLHYLLTPTVPIISALYGCGSEDIYIILYDMEQSSEEVSSISQLPQARTK